MNSVLEYFCTWFLLPVSVGTDGASHHVYSRGGQSSTYRRPTYKCEDAINANANVFPIRSY